MQGQTPLHLAATLGLEDMITLLASAGADIDAKNMEGHTPLSFAAAFGEIEAIKLLLDFGAHINSTDGYGRTPLMHAACFNRKENMRLLIEEQAHFEYGDEEDRSTRNLSMLRGTNYSVTEIIDQLIRDCTDGKFRGIKGKLPLSFVNYNGRIGELRTLTHQPEEIPAMVNGRYTRRW